MQNQTPLAYVCPEEIAILVDDEKLGGNLRGQPPFPFRHDRLGGADDSDGVVVLRL